MNRTIITRDSSIFFNFRSRTTIIIFWAGPREKFDRLRLSRDIIMLISYSRSVRFIVCANNQYWSTETNRSSSYDRIYIYCSYNIRFLRNRLCAHTHTHYIYKRSGTRPRTRNALNLINR